MKAGRTELDNLNAGTVTAISSERKAELRREARDSGQQFVELPSKGAFTINPDRYKIRILACNNETADTCGRVSTTDLDAAMLRYILSWAASSPDYALATLDVTAAFLNAPLPPGRIVVLSPPSILYKLQLLPPGHVWLVHKAIYGLREPPHLWSEQRTQSLTKLRFHSQGERYCVLLWDSQVLMPHCQRAFDSSSY